MESTRFDQLTKTLATSTSRRRALKAVGAAAVGGILGWRSTGTADAAGGGNSACAHFCAAVFGAGTTAAAQCTSDAAHGTGLCYTCGPASPGGGVAPAAICCTHTSTGYCASYTGAACCTSGQTCQNGTCAGCPPGTTVCDNNCVNTDTDPNNCGSCGIVCGSGICDQGNCICFPTNAPCTNGIQCCSGVCGPTNMCN